MAEEQMLCHRTPTKLIAQAEKACEVFAPIHVGVECTVTGGSGRQ
jgi:hypothetical protein